VSLFCLFVTIVSLCLLCSLFPFGTEFFGFFYSPFVSSCVLDLMCTRSSSNDFVLAPSTSTIISLKILSMQFYLAICLHILPKCNKNSFGCFRENRHFVFSCPSEGVGMFRFMRQQLRMDKLLITEYNQIRPTTQALAEVHIQTDRQTDRWHTKNLSLIITGG
jgi:hypothetical protein